MNDNLPDQKEYKKYNYKLTPFKLCVLQNFPFIEADFDAITNYQLLCKVVEYLNHVIDNQNTVEDNFKIMAENLNTLYNFLDTLDLQDEVNNKLDEMAEEGTLQEIISQYLNSNAIFGFNNVESMKNATNLINGSYAKTLGYYSINDGGGAIYKIRNITNDDIVDNAIIIPLADDNLIAEINENIVYPEMFGAKGDGITDDTNSLKSTFKRGRTIIFGKEKIYLVKSPITIYKGTSIDMSGSIITTEDTPTSNHLFHNFLESDTYLGYNGNGNIIIRNGIIQKGSIDFIHAENILFENISFEDCRRDHYIEICACKNFTVRDCSFTGMTSENPSVKEYINIDNCKYSNFPWFNQDSITYDGTIVNGVLVDNCVFDINNTLMEDAVGKHSFYDDADTSINRCKNISINNCRVYGATNSSFRFLGGDNINITNCYSDGSRRLYAFSDCNNIIIDNNKSINISENSSIYNSNNIKITNNNLELSANSWDIMLKGVCDNINYSFNNFKNDFGRRTPIGFQDNIELTITNLQAFNNNYSVSGNHGHLLVAPSQANNIVFGKIDEVSFNTVTTANTLVNNIFNLTQFNRLIIQVGEINNSNYQEVIVKSYSERNFVVGETYYFPIANGTNNTISIGSITITDEHTLTCPQIVLRHVLCQNLPRS